MKIVFTNIFYFKNYGRDRWLQGLVNLACFCHHTPINAIVRGQKATCLLLRAIVCIQCSFHAVFCMFPNQWHVFGHY